MAEETNVVSPKVFISYRWTSPEHENWVLDFATAMRGDGVDVRLDKWHLREGQDTLQFMETMVNDPELGKVLLICDRSYVERANGREGGVGTEAQIISAKVYDKSDQTKFAAIVRELDQDGKPLVPHYMASRLYFNMSEDDSYDLNYQNIVRWIFDRSFHVVPPLGEVPSFLDETYKPSMPSVRRADRLLKNHTTSLSETSNEAASLLAERLFGKSDVRDFACG